MLKNYKKTTKTHNEKSRKPNGSTTFILFSLVELLQLADVVAQT